MRRLRILSAVARERFTSMKSMTKALDTISMCLVEISERDGQRFLEDLIHELQQILADYDKTPNRRRYSHFIGGSRPAARTQEHAVPNDKKG